MLILVETPTVHTILQYDKRIVFHQMLVPARTSTDGAIFIHYVKLREHLVDTVIESDLVLYNITSAK